MPNFSSSFQGGERIQRKLGVYLVLISNSKVLDTALLMVIRYIPMRTNEWCCALSLLRLILKWNKCCRSLLFTFQPLLMCKKIQQTLLVVAHCWHSFSFSTKLSLTVSRYIDPVHYCMEISWVMVKDILICYDFSNQFQMKLGVSWLWFVSFYLP